MTANWTQTERAAFETRRKSRNLALGLVLGALVILFFGITVVRMAAVIANAKPPVGTSVAAPATAGSRQ
jgi:hypothetical protein